MSWLRKPIALVVALFQMLAIVIFLISVIGVLDYLFGETISMLGFAIAFVAVLSLTKRR